LSNDRNEFARTGSLGKKRCGFSRHADLKSSPTVCTRLFLCCALSRETTSAFGLGFGKENASALIKALEKEAGVEVKAS
jgi:hypothetical protein